MALRQSAFFTMLAQQAGDGKQRILAACCVAGIAQGLTVFCILSGIEELSKGGVHFHTFLLFLINLLIFYRLFRYSTEHAALLALHGVMEWRIRLAAKLRAVPMEYFGRLRQEQIQSALMDSREMVVEAARMFMAAAANSVMMVAAVGKMFATSFTGACGVLLCMCLGLGIFLKLVNSVNALMLSAQKADRNFSAGLQDLQQGFQLLKIHQPKTTRLFGFFLLPDLEKARLARDAMERRHALGISFFALFNLLILGLILFIMPRLLNVDTESLTTLLVLAVFCLSPMMSLVGFFPILGKVEMNLHELEQLEQNLDAAMEPGERAAAAGCWQCPAPAVPAFNSLSLHDISFTYRDTANTALFSVHIPEFTLNRGEIVFIRGGNGAGKSTFMRLLCGLYPPQSGDITLNGIPLTDISLESYRNIFSLVPTDFHLFRHSPLLPAPPEQIRATLSLLRLDTKVQLLEDGSFSTQALSAGQRKRLALACALLENRDVCIFDEVAADFDPEFRAFFYKELLPQLRGAGKTIFAVSHDDRYFHVADRVLTMADGRLFSEEAKKCAE